MRKVTVNEEGVAGLSAFPQASAGLPLALAGLFMHEFDTGFLPTTNNGKTNPSGLAFFCLLPRVYAGSCGFLRTAERAISATNR